MDIVPVDERLTADVRIGPQDIDQVQAGQKAEVMFPTLNKRQTPVLAGEVEVVSADRLIDPATNQALLPRASQSDRNRSGAAGCGCAETRIAG